MPKAERKRSSNWTFEEICLLTEFVKLHNNKLVGTSSCGKGSANIEKVKIHYWKASAMLVQNGCKERPWDRIRKKWNTVKSDARSYHRDCMKTGGGERPTPNRIFDKVLEALSPAAKDGILAQSDGESNPIPSTSTKTNDENIMEFLANAIIQGDASSNLDFEDMDEEEEEEEAVLPQETAFTQESDCPQSTACIQNTSSLQNVTSPQNPVCPPVSSKPRQDTVMQLERERLELDRERLQLDKEHLQVFTQIAGTLKEISENLKVFLTDVQFVVNK